VSVSDKEQRGIGRRGLLRGAAAGSLAGLVTACTGATAMPSVDAPAEEPACGLPAKWDREADVVVVGLGGAGGAAAIEAHDAGAKVLVLEKTPTPGGSTVLCAGVYYGAGTSLQEAEGIEDSADGMYEYALAMGKGLADPELVRVWADMSAETFEWIKGLGAEFYSGVNYLGGIPVIKPLDADEGWGLYYSGAEPDPEFEAITPAKPRGHMVRPVAPTFPYPPAHPSAPTPVGPTRGTGYFQPLWDAIQERGIEVLLETKALELVTDPVTKAVLGVKAESGGNTIYVKAKRAVALTAGGYSQGKDICKYFCQEALPATNYTASDTGDGILMGMAIGAGVKNMEQTLLSLSVPAGAIAVNSGGRRFVDETLYRVSGETWKGQRDWVAYAIFDDAIREATGGAETIQAPTIAELAEQIGMDPDVLEATVAFYNESVAMGKDREFGRTQRSSHKRPPDEVTPPPERAMVPIEKPPFHALRRDQSSLVGSQGITMGGLRINAKAQVYHGVSEEVIPRLYSAGRNSAGAMGEMYPGSGAAVSDALNFGRIAGRNAAAESPWE